MSIPPVNVSFRQVMLSDMSGPGFDGLGKNYKGGRAMVFTDSEWTEFVQLLARNNLYIDPPKKWETHGTEDHNPQNDNGEKDLSTDDH